MTSASRWGDGGLYWIPGETPGRLGHYLGCTPTYGSFNTVLGAKNYCERYITFCLKSINRDDRESFRGKEAQGQRLGRLETVPN